MVPDLPSTLHGLLLDWHHDFASGADAVMIARRNLDVDYLNDRDRELRQQEGRLGRLEIIVGERPIAAGDRVQTRINSHDVNNRDRWDVLSVDPLARSVELRRVGGKEEVVKLDKRYLERSTPDGAPALQHAYAITKFGAESKTFDRAYPLLDAGATLEQELVAISRGREIANVYTVLSPCPEDPAGAAAWGDAAHALASYRLRHNVRDPESALGQEPRAPAQRTERACAQVRIEDAQRTLRRAQDRVPEQESTRSL